MGRPLASIVKLIATPKLTAVGEGVLRAGMPFLPLVGNRTGAIDVRKTPNPEAGPAEQWVAVIGQLLPALNRIVYDTAAGSVDLYHDGDGGTMRLCVEKLAGLAAESAGRFMAVDSDRLSRMREELARALESSPIDLREEGAVERLRLIIDRL